MRQRCCNPKNPNFATYGGRGIDVDPRWRDFRVFCADVGPRPDGHTLERLDNARGYWPGNVRWASRWEQGQNRRHTPLIEHDGRRQSIGQWLRELPNPHRLHYSTIWSRVHAGATLLEALASAADPRFNPKRTQAARERAMALACSGRAA